MKKILLFLKQFYEFFVLKSPGFKKLGHSSEMRNDALMHRVGLKGYYVTLSVRRSTLDVRF